MFRPNVSAEIRSRCVLLLVQYSSAETRTSYAKIAAQGLTLFFICPIAIAWHMRQVIRSLASVCLYVCVCLSSLLWSQF